MDVSQYLEIFLDETKEHLQNLNTQILNLEAEPGNMDTINEIFRAAHSLKGMAGTMGYKRMQNLTHDMENVFSEVRNGNITVKPEMIDILFQCLDALEEYTNNIQTAADEGTNENNSLISALKSILEGKGAETKEASITSATQKVAVETSTEVMTSLNENTTEKKWLNIELNSSQLEVMKSACEQGHRVIGMTVKVQEACILKAARAFLVFKAIEEEGEIVFSVPTTQDIEDEKFELDFTLIVITQASVETIKEAAESVSEIEYALAEELDLTQYDKKSNVADDTVNQIEVQKAEKEEAVESNVQKSTPAVTSGVSAESTAANKDKKQTQGKPVVNRTVRVDIEKLDVLMNLVSELIIAKNSLVSATNQNTTGAGNSNVNEQIEYLESVTTDLHESVMKVRMVPIESVVNKFPRMIRDLTKKLNKQMELYMTGEETELDRTVVDEIGDPLMHLLRNAADHGLESTEERIRKGKPEVGSIYLDAFQDGNNVIIEVRDDGNGINVDSVRTKALERGTITPEQASNMSDKEIINLLFLPSFSTAKTVTDVSGRGVGLDVVKSKIEALSGEVEVKSVLGEGSTWTIRLPLTLAIIQALMVIVGNEKYAISLGSIQTIEDVKPSDVKFVQNKEVIHLRGNVIPLIRLPKILDVESTQNPDENMIVVIVKKGDKQAGLVIDDLIGQQEIVIKSLGKYIKQCKFISGATILGDGEVALILDANALI